MAKILLIDDDPDIRTVMSKVLNKQGYDVQTASCREEALEKLSHEKPAVILLDVLLSGSDGRELCRDIKNNSETKNIPIIMFSGHPVAAQQFESYGADDFISKPFNTETLLQKLSKQMGEVK
ncbi:MAG TPA: response regulator [Flavisolibacter sp.]|jgi:CheY-like chemotaxis protein